MNVRASCCSPAATVCQVSMIFPRSSVFCRCAHEKIGRCRNYATSRRAMATTQEASRAKGGPSHTLTAAIVSDSLRLDEQRPAVLKACTQSPHALCSQSGAAFLLTCLAQRAGEVEVAVEVQERRQQEVGSSFPQISRKKFREFLAELHEASHLDCILQESRYGVAKRSRHLMAGVS